MLLDHDGYLPSFAVITEGKKHEVRVARQMQFARGAILAFDRGDTDYAWFMSLTEQGVYFVTRLKESAVGIHWGIFQLTDEAWSEPSKLLLNALRRRAISPHVFPAGEPGLQYEATSMGEQSSY